MIYLFIYNNCDGLYIKANNDYARKQVNRLLRDELEAGSNVKYEHRYYVELPDISDHNGHVLGKVRYFLLQKVEYSLLVGLKMFSGFCFILTLLLGGV